MPFHSLYDTLRLKNIFLVGLCLSQYKVLARFKTVSDMFILTYISQLIANHLCSVYFSIDVSVRVPINPSVNATVTNGYKNKIVGGLVRTLQLFSLYSQSKYNIVPAMFVGKYLLYEAQCVKHEHSTQIQCVYCSELRLLLIICSFYFSALLMFLLSQKQCKISK